MKRYRFVVEGTISLHVYVEANDIDEAIDKAASVGVMGLCHQCARGDAGEWSTSGELDCDPATAPLVEVLIDDEPLSPRELARVKGRWG